MQDKNLVCITDNIMGIANRLKYLVSFLRYYNNPKHIDLVWPNKGWVTNKFFELFKFETDTIIQEYESLQEGFIQDNEFVNNWRLYVAPTDIVDKTIKNDDPFNKDTIRIDFLYNRTPQSIIDIYKPYFTKLHPTLDIKNIMEQVNIDEQCVAIQIRDNSDWKSWGRSSYLNLFIKEMKKYPKDTKFFISVMNEDISNIIKKQFPNQIIEVPDKDYTSMKYAVADMYLLSIPNRALCSCGSTFYEVSWWLGGCTADVKVIGNYKNWKAIKSARLQKIFSIKNDEGRRHKVITICGFKIAIRRKTNVIGDCCDKR